MPKAPSSSPSIDRLQNLSRLLLSNPVAALASPDKARSERALKFVLDEYAKLRELKTPLPTTILKVDKNNIESVGLNIRNISLFEPEKAWILLGVETLLKQEVTILSKILSLIPKGVLVFILMPDLGKGGAVIKDLEAKGLALDLGELHGATLLRWIERELKTQGISEWDAPIPDRLASLAEGSVDKVLKLIEQTSLYLDGARLTREAFETLFPTSIHATEFELLDALLAKDLRKAEVFIQALVRDGVNIFSLMGLLSKSLLNINRIKARLDRGESQADIRNKLGMQPWIFGKQVEVAKRIGNGKLDSTLSGLLRLDSKLKNKSLAHDALLSELREAIGARSYN